MGLFCSNIILKGPDSGEVLPYLRQCGRIAWISRTVDDVTVVFDDEFQGGHAVVWRRFEVPRAYKFGETAWEPLARDLSARFGCVVLAMEIHDDDYFYYQLYGDGRLVDEYVSDPDPFGNVSYYNRDPLPHMDLLSRSSMDHADILCRAFGVEKVKRESWLIQAIHHPPTLRMLSGSFAQSRRCSDCPRSLDLGKLLR